MTPETAVYIITLYIGQTPLSPRLNILLNSALIWLKYSHIYSSSIKSILQVSGIFFANSIFNKKLKKRPSHFPIDAVSDFKPIYKDRSSEVLRSSNNNFPEENNHRCPRCCTRSGAIRHLLLFQRLRRRPWTIEGQLQASCLITVTSSTLWLSSNSTWL